MKKLKKHYFTLFCLLLSNTIYAENEATTLTTKKSLLSLSLAELMEIKIETASKTSERISDVPANVVLVTRQEIERYGYTTLDEILQHVSGVYDINFYGLGSSAYGVRGFLSTGSSNRNIVVLVNGIDQVLDYDSSYLLPSIPVPVAAIDRIEIIRGPQSTIYGTGAFFGVVNIITNEIEQEEGAASQVSVAFGSDQLQQRFARSSYKTDQGQIVMNAGYHRENGIDVPISALTTNNYPIDADLRTGGRLEHTQTYADVSARYQDFSLQLSHSETKREGFISQPSARTGSIRTPKTTRVRLGYDTDLTEQWRLKAHLTYIHADVDYRYDNVLANSPWGLQTETARTYESEITLHWHAQQLDWLTGFYYRYTPTLATYINVPSLPVPSLHNAMQALSPGEALAKQALFSQVSYEPNKHWKWVLGLRLEQQLGYSAFSEYGYRGNNYHHIDLHYADQDVAVIPRFALIYQPNSSQLFKLLYGKAINSPSFGQNTTARTHRNLPSLENEEIETIEFNYITDLSSNYSLSANIFRNYLNKLLTNMATLDDNGQYLSSLGNAGRWHTNG